MVKVLEAGIEVAMEVSVGVSRGGPAAGSGSSHAGLDWFRFSQYLTTNLPSPAHLNSDDSGRCRC